MSKKILSAIIAVLLLVIAAFALNPSAAQHRNAIRDAVADQSPIAGMLGLGALVSLATDYHSAGVFSYTKADDRVISIGAFGLVHVIRRSTQE